MIDFWIIGMKYEHLPTQIQSVKKPTVTESCYDRPLYSVLKSR